MLLPPKTKCFLIISIIYCFIFLTNCQDMYGAQYNNPTPDEARQRARLMPSYEEQNRAPACNGPWQWACDNFQCIAQYDLCDGIEQCADGSDERNCRGRYPPSFQNNNPPNSRPKPPEQAPNTSPQSLTTSTMHKTDTGHALPIKLVAFGALAFIFVAVLANFLMKKSQVGAAVRNYRKGQSLVDDEDDLLISQMYS
uniref:Uncharacterized protein n=1 Tax=Panagrolaimus sp. JU765 TaxID=591449 RepID=A0AC34RAS4_9BILA